MSTGLKEKFLVGRLYRLARGADEPKLRGRVVTYLGELDESFRTVAMGGPSHHVALVNPDGSVGEKWLVRASIICRL